MKKTKSIGRLNIALEQIPCLRKQQLESQAFTVWRRDTKNAIENIFGKKSDQVHEFDDIRYYVGFTSLYTEADSHRDFLSGLDDAEALLMSMKNEIEEYLPSWIERGVSKVMHFPKTVKAFWLNHWKVLLPVIVAFFIGLPNVIKYFKNEQPPSLVSEHNNVFVDNSIDQSSVNFNGNFDSMTAQTNLVPQMGELFRNTIGTFSDTISNQLMRLEKTLITKLPKDDSQANSISAICTNTVLYAPASFLALHKQMAETYNNGNMSNAVVFAQQGISLWEKVSSIYSNETVLVDRRFLDSISSMLTVKAESCMYHKNFEEALYGFDRASKLNPFNTITNDAFMVAAAQLASNDLIVGNMISSYQNKTGAERYAFGNLLTTMGYLLPYKVGRDDKGKQFYTSIDIVKTLHLTNAVQYPFMIRVRNAGAENVVIVPRWIGLNQFEPLHLDSVAYEKQRKEFELSHLNDAQTNSVNTASP